jgi:hypothetical protein
MGTSLPFAYDLAMSTADRLSRVEFRCSAVAPPHAASSALAAAEFKSIFLPRGLGLLMKRESKLPTPHRQFKRPDEVTYQKDSLLWHP